MKKKPSNMTEFAKALGLSRATVSYVFNDKWRKHSISEATAIRVREYAEETGFTQNIFSLALKKKFTHDIAVLLPIKCLEHQKRAFFTLIDWIQKKRLNYIVLPHSRYHYRIIAQQLSLYQVKRVIAIAFNHVDELDFWENMFSDLPKCRWAFYDFPFEKVKRKSFLRKNVFCVGIDREKARKSVFQHLATCGYHRLILQDVLLESKQLVSIFKRMNLSFSPDMCYSLPKEGSLLQRGEAIGKQILNLPFQGKQVAVYINDDLLSVGAIRVMQQAGVKIPRDIGVISWDGLPESRYFCRDLTTLVIPHQEMLQATYDWIAMGKKLSGGLKLKPYIREGNTLKY